MGEFDTEGDVTQDQPDAGTGPVEQEGGATNDGQPPWADYLTDLPDSVRPLVEPKFKEWDASVTKRFQSLQSEYDPYKPLIAEYEPDALQQAVHLAQAMEANPQEFLARVAEAYGIEFGSDQGTADQQELEEPADNDDPYAQRFQQHEQLLQTMAEAMINERQQQEHAQADWELDGMLTELATKHGEFDEAFVLTQVANGVPPEQAVQNFQSIVQGYAQKLNQPSQQAPSVVSGGGGGYPSQQVNPNSLNSQGRKDLIVQMLRAANEQ